MVDTLLITNPSSRSGDSGIGRIVESLQADGSVHVYRTDVVADPVELIRETADASTRVIVGGGDGTLNWLLGAVLDSGATLGVLPMGTANDFARALGIPDDLEEAAEVIRSGNIRKVDVGQANDRFFLNAAGVGLGPMMTGELSDETKGRLGVFAYLTTAIGVLRRSRSFAAILRVDGNAHPLRCLQVTIASGRHYGGGMTIADDAEVDDGKLRVLSVRRQSLWRLAAKFVALRWGSLRNATDLALYEGAEAVLETRKPMSVTVDGELVSTTPLRCRILPRRLPVFAPPRPAD